MFGPRREGGSGRLEPSGRDQVGPVGLFPLVSLREPDLGQDAKRSLVPIPDRGPQAFVSGRSRPVQHRPGGLCRVAVTPEPAEQLKRQFRLSP